MAVAIEVVEDLVALSKQTRVAPAVGRQPLWVKKGVAVVVSAEERGSLGVAGSVVLVVVVVAVVVLASA